MKKLLLLFVLLTSCVAKKESTTSQIVTSSNIIHEIKNVQLPVRNVTIIDVPCKDSVLQPFYQTIQSGKTKIIIREIHGKLSAEINIDSIVNSRLSEIEKKTDTKIIEKTITKIVTPKWAWYLLITVIVYIAYRILRIIYPIIGFLPY